MPPFFPMYAPPPYPLGAATSSQTYTGYQAAMGDVPTTPWATAALICGFFALILPIPFGLLGIIYGSIALGKIKQSGDRLGGRGMAIAGIAMGAGALALIITTFVLYFVFILPIIQSISPPGG